MMMPRKHNVTAINFVDFTSFKILLLYYLSVNAPDYIRVTTR